jgi:hypothetical protein
MLGEVEDGKNGCRRWRWEMRLDRWSRMAQVRRQDVLELWRWHCRDSLCSVRLAGEILSHNVPLFHFAALTITSALTLFQTLKCSACNNSLDPFSSPLVDSY